MNGADGEVDRWQPQRRRERAGSDDSNELAGFGYKQELDRSLGSFSSFAAGFSYISILTGVTALYGFGYANAGPGVWWTWPVVVGGQILVALCFMELAAQYPIAGSVYQWSKQLSTGFTSWMTGWIYIVGAIVTIAAVAIDWQVVLPQITTHFQFVGCSADAGSRPTKGGAQNALLLGAILIGITTTINMLGVKLMSRINNVGVAAELIGSTLLIILLLFHLHHGPQIIVHSYGFGAGHKWGYFGALLIGGLLSAYVMYGFDTAGTLAEETNNPRKHAPPAIIRAIVAAALVGGLVILLGSDVEQEHLLNKNIGLLGLPYVIKSAFGNTTGNVFLADTALAIFVCCLAVQTATIRMLFSMARDSRLPFGSQIARVSGHRKVPIVPALVTGILALALLVINVGNQSAFLRDHLDRDHHVLPGLPRGDRPDAPSATPRRLAEARPRAVLLARALGAAGQHRGRGLRHPGRAQHRLAAQLGLQRRRHAALVLAVVAGPVHRRRADHRHASTTSPSRPGSRRRCLQSTGPTFPCRRCRRRWEMRRRDRLGGARPGSLTRAT